jgi:hypothetical protein
MASSIVKKFGQLRQWTGTLQLIKQQKGEVLGGTQKTETSEDFKRLDNETLCKLDAVSKLENVLSKIVRHLCTITSFISKNLSQKEGFEW